MSPGPRFMNVCDAAAQICMNHTPKPIQREPAIPKLETHILPRIPYKTNQAQKFSDLLENLEPTPRIFENSNVRGPAGTRVGET